MTTHRGRTARGGRRRASTGTDPTAAPDLTVVNGGATGDAATAAPGDDNAPAGCEDATPVGVPLAGPTEPIANLVVGDYTPEVEQDRLDAAIAAHRAGEPIPPVLVEYKDGEKRVVGQVENYAAAREVGLTDVLVLPAIHVDDVLPSPYNPRKDTIKPDKKTVDSIKESRGVLQPVGIYRENGKTYLSIGHRRQVNARAAGYPYLPFRWDNRPRAEIIRDMVIENDDETRVPLTPDEEGAAFEAMMLDGLSIEKIAAAHHRTPDTVRGQINLKRLSKDTCGKIGPGRGQLDLDEVIRVASIENTTVRSSLEKQLGKQHISAYTVKDRLTRDEVKRKKKQAMRDARAKGLKVLTENELKKVDGMQVATKQPPARGYYYGPVAFVKMAPDKHAKLACHAVYFRNGSDSGNENPVPCCVNPGAHNVTPPDAKRREEMARAEKEQARTRTFLGNLDTLRLDALPRLLGGEVKPLHDLLVEHVVHIAGRDVAAFVADACGVKLRKDDDPIKRLVTAAKRWPQEKRTKLAALCLVTRASANMRWERDFGPDRQDCRFVYGVLALVGYEPTEAEAALVATGKVDLTLVPEVEEPANDGDTPSAGEHVDLDDEYDVDDESEPDAVPSEDDVAAPEVDPADAGDEPAPGDGDTADEVDAEQTDDTRVA